MRYDSPSRTSGLDSLHFEHGININLNETGTGSDAQSECLSTSIVDKTGTFGPQPKCRRPSEPWSPIASPSRVLNEEFNCDTESPLLSLVQAISEVSGGNTPLEAYHNPCIPQDVIDRKPMLDLLEVLTPTPTPDPFFSHSGLESPMLKTYRRDSSPISRAFRSENTCTLGGSSLRLDTPINRNSDTSEPQCENSYPSIASLPSPVFATPSPSSSLGTTLTLQSNPPTPTAMVGPKLDDSFLGRGSERLPPLKCVSSSSECLESISTPPSSRAMGSHSDQEVPTVNSTQPVRSYLVTSLPDTYNWGNVLDLPPALSWLKTVKPELWIDQEGFRSTRASFRLVGYSQTDRSFSPFQSGAGVTPGAGFSPGIADFIPAKRQIFIFHRSALDTPPVLRRLTIEGDNSRDFLSRQASLTLKNGVYTVRGSEASSAVSPVDVHTGSNAAALSLNLPDVKFKWKFDYLVRDRRTKRSGQVMKGEKTLTPLAFSCSPWMLSLQQSRKINLMHIVKKTVAMNLTAERVEPPLPPLPPSIMVLCNAEIEAATMVLHLPPGRLNKLQSHRRARSHTVKENLETTNSPSQRIIATSVLRHRRASSAGANTLMRPVNGRSNGPGMIPALPILPQHILPLRQIAESSQRRPAVVARPETYF